MCQILEKLRVPLLNMPPPYVSNGGSGALGNPEKFRYADIFYIFGVGTHAEHSEWGRCCSIAKTDMVGEILKGYAMCANIEGPFAAPSIKVKYCAQF